MTHHEDSMRRILTPRRNNRKRLHQPTASMRRRVQSNASDNLHTSNNLRQRYLPREEQVVMRKCTALRSPRSTAQSALRRRRRSTIPQTCKAQMWRGRRIPSRTGSTERTLCMDSQVKVNRRHSPLMIKYHDTRDQVLRPRHWRPHSVVRRTLATTLQERRFPQVRRCLILRHPICLLNTSLHTPRQLPHRRQRMAPR